MISMDKKYRTRDGREVRIYAVDGGCEYPVHGAYKNDDGTWCPDSWNGDGRYLSDREWRSDLIEVRTAEEVAAEVVAKIAGEGYADTTAAKVCQALRDSGHLREDT